MDFSRKGLVNTIRNRLERSDGFISNRNVSVECLTRDRRCITRDDGLLTRDGIDIKAMDRLRVGSSLLAEVYGAFLVVTPRKICILIIDHDIEEEFYMIPNNFEWLSFVFQHKKYGETWLTNGTVHLFNGYCTRTKFCSPDNMTCCERMSLLKFHSGVLSFPEIQKCEIGNYCSDRFTIWINTTELCQLYWEVAPDFTFLDLFLRTKDQINAHIDLNALKRKISRLEKLWFDIWRHKTYRPGSRLFRSKNEMYNVKLLKEYKFQAAENYSDPPNFLLIDSRQDEIGRKAVIRTKREIVPRLYKKLVILQTVTICPHVTMPDEFTYITDCNCYPTITREYLMDLLQQPNSDMEISALKEYFRLLHVTQNSTRNDEMFAGTIPATFIAARVPKIYRFRRTLTIVQYPLTSKEYRLRQLDWERKEISVQLRGTFQIYLRKFYNCSVEQ